MHLFKLKPNKHDEILLYRQDDGIAKKLFLTKILKEKEY